MASKARFLSRNTTAWTPEMKTGQSNVEKNLENKQRDNFFKNIEIHSKKAEDNAENSYNVKESTVTRAKEGTNKSSSATLGGFFSRAEKNGRGLQFNNLQSYRTVSKDNKGQKLDNEKAPEEISDDENFGGKETTMKERISSTAIDNINYNPKSKDLLVQFKGGTKKYLFPKVPKDVVKRWLKAGSKGRFYGKHIKEYSVAKK